MIDLETMNEPTASQSQSETSEPLRRRRRRTSPLSQAISTGDTAPAGFEPDTSNEPPAKQKRISSFEADCVGLYATLGTYLLFVPPLALDGATIVEQSPKRGHELAELGSHHPAVKKAIKTMAEGGDVVVFVGGQITLALALLANHPETQQRVFGSVQSFARRMLRRPEPAAASTAPAPTGQPAPMTAWNMAEPPEARVVEGPLPVFHAQPMDIRVAPTIASETDYASFGPAGTEAQSASMDGSARLAAGRT